MGMKITVVGTGYVGLVTGTCFANAGNNVICLDVDENKIEKLKNGISPIYEPGLDELITRNTKAGRLKFTTDMEWAYSEGDIVFICVGTPCSEDGSANLGYILGAARDIGDAIERLDAKTIETSKIVIVKSTVPVGTNVLVSSEIQRHTKKPFRMASNPEFLKEGAALNDFNKPDRVVLGVSHPSTSPVLHELYAPFVRQGNPIFVMDIPSAEMVKYASNAMLATKISFINEIANLCESYGADIGEVRRGMCSDRRIGNQFLYPGVGYGGSCFPKDVQACVSMGRQTRGSTPLLSAVHEVNQRQRQLFSTKILDHFGGHDVSGKRIAIWGIAFKQGTDDIREAPSISIMSRLMDRGAEIVAYDPVAADNCKEKMGDRVQFCDNPVDCLDDADALVICTEWGEFQHPDPEEFVSRMRSPVIFDGRNLFNEYKLQSFMEAGITYYSVGRNVMTGNTNTSDSNTPDTDPATPMAPART